MKLKYGITNGSHERTRIVNKRKKLFLRALSYQKDLKCFCLTIGHLIFKVKRVQSMGLDGNQYLVLNYGIGTNILGYGHPDVDNVVKENF